MDLEFGDYRLKIRERELIGPSGPVALSARAFELLRALLAQPEVVLSKDALFDAAWPGRIVEDNTLQVHMSGLRKALGAGYIATVHGRGYKYVGPPPSTSGVDDAQRPMAAEYLGNIHRYQSDCIEREGEAREITELLVQHRLVSIVGPGGVGKTTLATTVAADFHPAGGVWVVDLAPIDSGAIIPSAVIQALGVAYLKEVEPLQLIVQHLRQSAALLLFDNCEHVQSEAASFIQRLLGDVPTLRVLTTSQVPLGVDGERVFKLLPFALAEDGAEKLSPSEQFLCHCVAMAGEDVSPAEHSIVRRLCRRLDGVALAIKMAAARASTVGLARVDEQIEQQLAGIEADWNTPLPRHRSLLASLRWSYDLLPDDIRRTLRLLSVFAGSFSLAAALAVAGGSSELHLSELVRRSLVVRDRTDHDRFRLLDTTRRFAVQELVAAGEEQAARDRHAAFVTELFASSIENWETTPDAVWEARYKPDGDNLRAALNWTRGRPHSAGYVELVAETSRFFLQEQLGVEGLATMESALHLAPAASARAQARLGLALGEMARVNASDVLGRQSLQAALGWLRQNDRSLRYFQALILLTWITIFFRDKEEMEPLIREVGDIIHRMTVSKTKAWALVALGTHMWLSGDREAGLARCNAGFAMSLETGNLQGRLRSVMNFTEMVHKHGDTRLALDLARGVLPDVRRHATPLRLAIQLGNIAAYLFWLGDVEAAEKAHLESASLMWPDGSYWHLSILQNAAERHFWRRDHKRAALLLGIIDKRIEASLDGRQTTEQLQRDRLDERLKEALGVEEHRRILEQGAALDLDDARSLAE